MRSRLSKMRKLLLLTFLLALPAHAILVEDGNVTESAPADDPGWANVGRITGAQNAVYVGHGWALTASHVYTGFLEVTFDGVAYPIVSGSEVTFQHDLSYQADLKAFRVLPYPRHLPVLPIASSFTSGEEEVLIGRGWGNGGAIGNPPVGYSWSAPLVKRWGTNHLGGTIGGSFHDSLEIPFNGLLTQTFVSQFDENGSEFEGTGTEGDSGGALFVDRGGVWELAGIHWGINQTVLQQATYGDDSLSVDLTRYRDQVLAIVRPCNDGADNDGDGDIDGADAECLGPGDPSEQPGCSDGLDNDADGNVDMADPDCASTGDLLEGPDADADLIADYDDNCTNQANFGQIDSNLDGYGNWCDADYNDDGIIGIPDIAHFITPGLFGSSQGEPGYDPDVDFNSDGIIGVPELGFMTGQFGKSPGPSGLACAGAPPCP